MGRGVGGASSGEALHAADVALGDAGVVEVLQAFDTEDVGAGA